MAQEVELKFVAHFDYLEKTRQKRVDARADRERGDGGMPFDLMPKTELVDVGIEKYYFDLIALKIYDDNNQIYKQNFTKDKTYTLSYNGKDYEFDDLKFSLKNFKNLMGADTKKLSENMYVKIQLKKKSSFLPQSVNIKFTEESIRKANDDTYTYKVVQWPIIAKMVCFTEPFQIKIQDKPSETLTGRGSSVPETSLSPVPRIVESHKPSTTFIPKLPEIPSSEGPPSVGFKTALTDKLTESGLSILVDPITNGLGIESIAELKKYTIAKLNFELEYEKLEKLKKAQIEKLLENKLVKPGDNDDDLAAGGHKRRKTKRKKSKTKRKKSLKKKSLKRKKRTRRR